MTSLSIPKRKPGRPSAASAADYEHDVIVWCAGLKKLASTIEFKVSSRGWCYVLEEHGLPKGDFDRAQSLINWCRSEGYLPIDLTAVDETRLPENMETIDKHGIDDKADLVIDAIGQAHKRYNPVSLWDFQNFYIEMWVEKIDLRSLFSPVCAEFHIPISNAKGWSDINMRGAMMRRFADWETKGKQCVLLYCGDFDPGGLQISKFIRKNLADKSRAVGWSPDNLIVNRFGLNLDFIIEHDLTWIDNLETSGGGRLDDPRHPDHQKEYVQSYLQSYGARKVEANTLVVRTEAGRNFCREAILQYVDTGAIAEYEFELTSRQASFASVLHRRLAEFAANGGAS